MVKNPPANAGDIRDMDLIPGSVTSPGGGNGNPFQYSCLGNPMDTGAWHGVARVRHDLATKPSPPSPKSPFFKYRSIEGMDFRAAKLECRSI
nr:hypothetical protein [Streptococcus agalactiae]